MTVSPDQMAHHRREAAVAADNYIAELTYGQAAGDWRHATVQARRAIICALRLSVNLTDIAAALRSSGSHMRVFRHILAPPISQDQFKLLCPTYSKSVENRGGPVQAEAAAAIAATVLAARDRPMTRWLDRGGPPRPNEIRRLLHAVSPLISQQVVATVRRNRLSTEQENAVICLLESKGWSRMNTGLIKTLSDVPTKHFMHKTKFATTTLPQEVDIACGLGNTVVLAMECKVTNDQTNSVKRVNDVLKKAAAWQAHWGSFVRTAALLQGVIGYKDIHRLLDARVEVFWSHRLEDFAVWIDDNAAASSV